MKHEIEKIIDLNNDECDFEIEYQTFGVTNAEDHSAKGTMYDFDITSLSSGKVYEIIVIESVDKETISFIQAKDITEEDEIDLLTVVSDPEKFKKNVEIWGKQVIL